MKQKLMKVRLHLMLREPYLASAVARHPIFCARNPAATPTFATDGYRIFYNPSFVQARSLEDLEFILAHEVLHCLLGHIDRRGDRQPSVWNIAADLAVNSALSGFGFGAPEDALLDWRTSGMTVEDIYAELIQQQEKLRSFQKIGTLDVHLEPGDGATVVTADSFAENRQGLGGEEGSGASDVSDVPSPLERRRIRKQLLGEMLRDSRLPGAVRGRLLEEARRASEHQVDWREQLADFMTGLRRDDYRSFPFNRKHLWRGLYLPSHGVPAPSHLVVAVDTSGSITSVNLSQFLAELDMLRATTRCRLTVLEFDVEIAKITRLDDMDRPTVSMDGAFAFAGRGGTDIRAPFDWVRREVEDGDEMPDAMIVATDGFGPMPIEPPPHRVLWIVPPGGLESFPFGRAVRLEV